MTDDEQVARLRALLREADAEAPRGVAPARVQQVCRLAVSRLEVDGAGVTVMGDAAAAVTGGIRDLLHAHDPVSRDLEDVHLTTGQGPCFDAVAEGVPVLVPDLAADDRWPGFRSAALGYGAAAVFSFPLQVGAVRLGSLNLWRAVTGALHPVGGGLVLAEAATEALLDELDSRRSDRDAHRERPTVGRPGSGWLPDAHAEVHQASGMVAVDLGVGVGAALLRLRSYAFGRDLTIAEVARRVVHEHLSLDADP